MTTALDVWNSVKKAAIFIVAVFLIGGLFGWLLYAKCNPPPVIIPGKPDTNLTITKPPLDTSRPKPIIKIKYDTVFVDSSKPTVPPASGDTACWLFKDTTESKAIWSLDLCSKELPKKQPLDLSTFFTLQLPEDTAKVIHITDSLLVKPSVFKDWRNYAIPALVAALIYCINRATAKK
jgi:hypothetical protein